MKEDFTEYDIKPKDFLNYLRYYGNHFNKKLCEFACLKLGSMEYTKDKFNNLLTVHKIDFKDYELYDILYLLNYGKCLHYGSALPDDKYLLLYARDILNKESDLIFNKWYADCAKKGIVINWEDML